MLRRAQHAPYTTQQPHHTNYHTDRPTAPPTSSYDLTRLPLAHQARAGDMEAISADATRCGDPLAPASGRSFPRHMRRRTRSHKAYKFPVHLQQKAAATKAKSMHKHGRGKGRRSSSSAADAADAAGKDADMASSTAPRKDRRRPRRMKSARSGPPSATSPGSDDDCDTDHVGSGKAQTAAARYHLARPYPWHTRHTLHHNPSTVVQ